MADQAQASDDDNVKDLKGQFDQQQAMIGQLRDILKQKEITKLQEEKKIEDYATRLAKMKPRFIKGKGRGRVKEREEKSQRESQSFSLESPSFQPLETKQLEDKSFGYKSVPEPTAETLDEVQAANVEVVSLLPQVPAMSRVIPLESEPSSKTADTENRAKILLLRKQLEENRMKFERQQKDYSNKRADMKDRMEIMRIEIEERDTVIQSLKNEDSLQMSDVDVQHLYRQIIQKDNCLFDLTDKVQHLESILQDHHEQLDEKDQIIAARTEAVALIAKGRDEKMHSVVQELEEVRLVMRGMQTNFMEKEEIWLEKEKCLSSKIEERTKKVIILEENCQRVENIRFELSARNAELQEKIVKMLAEAQMIQNEVLTLGTQNENKDKEVMDLKSKLVRAESFGQKKLKALEKQVKNISSNSDIGEKILGLENEIAMLEEEKGNLQLKLVDFDDLKAYSNQIKGSLKEMEEKLIEVNGELISQMNSVSSLERDKINLVESLNAKCLLCNLQEEEFKQLSLASKEQKQTKVTLELRLCALEEERDSAIKNERDLENERVPQQSIEELNVMINNMQRKISSLHKEIAEKDQKLVDYNNTFSEKESIAQLAMEEKENKLSENQCLISMLAEKENVLMAQSITIEKHSAIVEKLEQNIFSKCATIEEKVINCKEFEQQIENQKLSFSEFIIKSENLDKVISDLQEKMHISEAKVAALKNSEKKLNSVLVEKEKAILITEGEVCSAIDEVSKKCDVIAEQIKRLDHLESLLAAKEQDLLCLEISYSNQAAENMEKDTHYKKLEKDIVNAQKCLKDTESRLTAECETISCLLSDRDNEVTSLEQKVQIKIQELTNNQIMISKFESEACETNRFYDNLVLEKESLIGRMSSLQAAFDEANASLEIHAADINDLQNLCQHKNSLLEQFEIKNAETTEKLRLLKDNSEVINDKALILEKELCDMKSSIESKDNSYKDLEIEFQTFYCNKENEFAHLGQLLNEKEDKIIALNEASGIASEKLEETEKWQTEVNEKSELLLQLEHTISIKDQTISDSHFNIEMKAEEIQNLGQQLGNLNNEITFLKTMNEQNDLQLSETSNQLNSLKKQYMEIADSNEQLQESLLNLQHEIDEKSKHIINLQATLEGIEGKTGNEIMKATNDLQNQLEQYASQNIQLTQYYENRLLEETQVISSLQQELNQVKALQESAMYELQSVCDQLRQKLNDSEVKSSEVSIELDEAKNKIEQLDLIKAEFEIKLKEKNDSLSTLHSEKQILPTQSVSPSDFFDQFQATSVSSDGDTLLKENGSLRDQLNAAQQAIVLLETSLATQAEQQSDSSQDTVESWGVIDLGEPSGPDSMTTSLIEKDKTLTVIQEQLKESLEQVNTVSDAKKVIQHQMKTLEAELNHSKNKVLELESLIMSSNQQAESLSQENVALQDARLTAADQNASSISSVIKSQELVKESIVETEKSTASWFQPSTPKTESAGLFDIAADEGDFEEEKKVVTLHHEGMQETVSSIVEDLQYKLSWYEDNWVSWSTHCEQLQKNLEASEQQIEYLKQQQEFSQSNTEIYEKLQQENISLQALMKETQIDSAKLAEANQEIDRLRLFETQVYELRNEIQASQHQISVLEDKVKEADNNIAELHEYKVLFEELQISFQEAEAKTEGMKSRVQELELMVQSAETEIARLRTQITTLNDATENLDREKSVLKEDLDNEKEELRKSNVDKQCFEAEMSRLQIEASGLHSQLIESQTFVQRKTAELEQMRSEIEVLEGDSDRLRSNYEILESDHNRIRSEQEIASQNYQMLVAQNESSETEIQRLHDHNQSLSLDGEHSRGDVQRLSEVSTSAESEISRLQMELNNARSLNSKYQDLEESKLQQSNAQPLKEILLQELDWSAEGRMEDEHLKRSISVEKDLREKLDQLMQRSIELEREKNHLTDDLQAYKLKNGKMIQRLKAVNNKNENLTKELEKLKKGGFSNLDQALEDEMKIQIKKAENERNELKAKLDEMEKEKDQKVNKIDVLENAQERYIEMKELQDASMQHISIVNKNLESQVATLEWKMSELEESSQEQLRTISNTESKEDVQPLQRDSSENLHLLNQTVHNQELQIVELTNQKIELETNIVHLESKFEEISLDNDNIQALLNSANEIKRKSDADVIAYKTSFIDLTKEYENLKECLAESTQEVSKLQENEFSLRVSYDSVCKQFVDAQDTKDIYKYDSNILEADRDKYQELALSLEKQLNVMREDEPDDVFAAIQDECSQLRNQNVTLKDEMLEVKLSLQTAEDSNEQLQDQFEKHYEEAERLHQSILITEKENQDHEGTIDKLMKESKYLKAEAASLRSKSSQQQQTLEVVEPQLIHLKKRLQNANQQINDLKMQIEIADGSLSQSVTSPESSEKNLSDRSKEELDATLMSLHLRDLRCQQLSLEINKLLEERDSLQLKWSATLRQNQELSRELSKNLHSPTTPPPSLNRKLAELRELNTGLEEKALRQFMLPMGARPPSIPSFISHTAPSTPTATRHVDYTVTRESQGSSGTLMNWIMGKSPPKEVMHV